MRGSPGGPAIVCREYWKEASRCTLQVARYVTFNDPLVYAPIAGKPIPHVGDGVIDASIWPESIGVDTKVRFPYGFQDHAKGFLDNPVVNGGDTERPLFSIGFGDIRPSDRHGFKGFGSECFAEALQVAFHVPIEVAHGFAVYAGRFSSLVGIDSLMSDSEPHDITEQAIEVHKTFGILCRPLTRFPLHFAHIHRASPVPELPLHKKFPKAKGLRHWGLL